MRLPLVKAYPKDKKPSGNIPCEKLTAQGTIYVIVHRVYTVSVVASA